jgi:hypothetical protein
MELGWYCKAYKGNLFSSATKVFKSWNLLPANVNPTIFKLKEQPLANGFEITNENYIAIDISKPDEVVLSKGIYWYQLINSGVDYSMNYYWDTNLAYNSSQTYLYESEGHWRPIWGSRGDSDDADEHEFWISPTPQGSYLSYHKNVPNNVYSLPQFSETRNFVEFKIKLKMSNTGATSNPRNSARLSIGQSLTDESRHVRLVIQKAKKTTNEFSQIVWEFTDVTSSDYQYLPSKKQEWNLLESQVDGVGMSGIYHRQGVQELMKDKEFTFTNVTLQKDEFYVFQLKCYKQNIEFYYGLVISAWKGAGFVSVGRPSPGQSILHTNQYLSDGYLSIDRSEQTPSEFNTNFPIMAGQSSEYYVPIMSFSGIYYLKTSI